MGSIQLGIQYSISSMTKFEERDLLMQVINHLPFSLLVSMIINLIMHWPLICISVITLRWLFRWIFLCLRLLLCWLFDIWLILKKNYYVFRTLWPLNRPSFRGMAASKPQHIHTLSILLGKLWWTFHVDLQACRMNDALTEATTHVVIGNI